MNYNFTKRLILAFFLISLWICLDHGIYESEQLNISGILNTSLKTSICSSTEYEAEKFTFDNNINYNVDEIYRNVKFIVGNCNPMILVPGIYSES